MSRTTQASQSMEQVSSLGHLSLSTHFKVCLRLPLNLLLVRRVEELGQYMLHEQHHSVPIQSP